ncbi:LOW QUALITY PROTEIN: guanidino acid hydrolase, mitochondrial [Pituophis catenifer annectens]|uniref:LOW QUALITY PROTEIN: guanidino acid hydrolase, mitochondrial n=1 Tax=Pituophis catenifer annectens TaxID=94852 RepID=UPI0039958EBB
MPGGQRRKRKAGLDGHPMGSLAGAVQAWAAIFSCPVAGRRHGSCPLAAAGGRDGLALLPGSCQGSSLPRLLSGNMAVLLAPGGQGLLRASLLGIPRMAPAVRSCCSKTHLAIHRGIGRSTPGGSFLHAPLGRKLPCPRRASGSAFNIPPSAEEIARPVGVCSMFKLPMRDSAEGLDVAFVGVPLDIGTTHRPGARFGPRHLRAESILVRHFNPATGADPYHSLQVADIGDVNINLYDLKDSCRRIREAFRGIVAGGCIPLTLGGDHTITYPILQAMAEKHGPVALIHVDAHTDTADQALGERIYHGSPFRRSVEEGLLDCQRVFQIGIRGSSYSPDPYRFSWDQGFRVVLADDCWMKSLAPLMTEVREQVGDRPLYISFDIDALDPAFAPGTGTPETAGLTPAQALEIIRGCQGLRVVGGDLVEVAPAYDLSGNTGLLGANLLFEMLCALPGVKRHPVPQKATQSE